MDIEDILIQLETEIKRGRKTLIGAGVIVDSEKIYLLIDQIRNSLPEIIRESQFIVRNSKEIEAESTSKAQKIVQEAQVKATKLVAESNVLELAEEEVKILKEQFTDYKKRVSLDISDDINTMLLETEKYLLNNLELIRKAKENNARNRPL